jgi:hypothetical protein
MKKIFEAICKFKEKELRDQLEQLQESIETKTQFGCAKARTVDLVIMKEFFK